ncbi:SulP family inorganic anion transporter [Membranihabitans maritimus]|uniref:SulP family inorganic anion transporter n=1 Tax=Membranihabitans maritimus TaxID=2904244 RepID=UPI001F0151AA|nr:SulP family inorganic anion transporter [Membranihabitans maritimus]
MSKYFSYLNRDIPASIVVFLVALPLCLGIALASGAPLLSGLISGIIGGIVIGLLSKSDLSVSGPAAGLVVIVLNAVDTLGTYEAFLVAVVLAGVIQLVLGFMKAGVIGLYFPSSVIKGMLAAIGLILIMKQLPHLVGFDTEAFTAEANMTQADGANMLAPVLSSFNHMVIGSLIIGVFSLLFLIVWSRPIITNNKFLKQIPGGVVVVIMGVVINSLFKQFYPSLAISPSHLVSIPVIGSMAEMSEALRLPDFQILTNLNVYVTAMTLAIVASLETLLCIEAVDKMDPEKRRTPQNTELKAQGVGNIVSGLIGGLPITSVIVRSSTNLGAGAKTKMSAVFHGIFLLLAVVAVPTIMNLIPLASLAAILIMVGFKLTKPALYRAQMALGKEQFIPFVVTVVSILFTDLLVGILIGMAVAVFYILRDNYKVPYYLDHGPSTNGDGSQQIRIQLSEHVSFLNKASLLSKLEGIPSNSEVELDGSRAKSIDHDALEVIHNFQIEAREKQIKFSMKNIPDIKNGNGAS